MCILAIVIENLAHSIKVAGFLVAKIRSARIETFVDSAKTFYIYQNFHSK